jgi:dienelactone hydrolase
MNSRNLSPQAMFTAWAQRHEPVHRFEPGSDFRAWKEAALQAVVATLGKSPPRVPLNPELTIEWTDRGIRKQRFLIDVGPEISAALQINFPSRSGKSPALLCWHGHGKFGKAPVMGNMGDHEVNAEISSHNYDYGHQMAEQGFVTYAIDWMGAGERDDRAKPYFLATAGGRDWCNLYYLHATMLGTTPLAINLTHARAATDFVCSLPEVDFDRLGVMGLSGGGAMTLWSALTDSRFGAAEIICYSDLWALFGFRDVNYCGSQVAPGLFQLVDLPDLQGLLAPLPLLVDIGANDQCFQPQNAMRCHARLREIYQAAGAGERLHLDLFPGSHAWGGNKSAEFFRQYLA